MSNVEPINTYRPMTEQELKCPRFCLECWDKPKRTQRIIQATHFKHVVIKGRYEYDEPVCVDCVPSNVSVLGGKTYDVQTQPDTTPASTIEQE